MMVDQMVVKKADLKGVSKDGPSVYWWESQQVELMVAQVAYWLEWKWE